MKIRIEEHNEETLNEANVYIDQDRDLWVTDGDSWVLIEVRNDGSVASVDLLADEGYALNNNIHPFRGTITVEE